MFKKTVPQLMLKTIQRNAYATGIAAGVLALGGVAAGFLRSPQGRARTGELTDRMRNWLPGRVAPERLALASADQPY